MRKLMLSWWPWVGLGLACGAVLATFYGEPSAGEARRITMSYFEKKLATPGEVLALRVYPPRENVWLVTFESKSADEGQYLYGKTPFAPDSPRGETVRDYLARKTVAYSYAWWTLPVWRYVLLCGAGALIGVTWPMALRLLAAAGYGPKPQREPAYDLDRFKPEPAATAARASAADLKYVEELDQDLEERLSTAGASPAPTTTDAPASPTVKPLSAGPLEQMHPDEHKDEKEYGGEFYPTERGGRHPPPHGFSLVELLVVIGLIAVLLAILLPTVAGARQAARTLQCASNLRSIGQAMMIYVGENRGTFPAAYLYIGHSIIDGQQYPVGTDTGYIHWSSYLYGTGKSPASAFTCPAMERGGLPPTNTTSDNVDPGQNVADPGIVDQQAPRLAYTVNEAICPRNKFVLGFQNAQRIYRFVKASDIANSSGTILGTEWIDNWHVISADMGAAGWVMSHRPISGFVASTGELDVFKLPPEIGFRRAAAHDLDPDPLTAAESLTRLDWVGRNHGKKAGYPDRRRTNFLYVDGHVATKTIYETLSPFEWGEQFYSLVPNNDLAP